MKTWHQRLIVIGLLLILAGFLFALVFSWSVDHEARLVAHDAYQPVFELIARNGETSEAWRALEERISAASVAHRRAADVHGHSINMGILVILLGLFSPLFSQHERANNRLLLAMAVSAVVYPAGLFLQFLKLELAGEIVSAIGAAGAVIALGVLYFRFSKAVDTVAD